MNRGRRSMGTKLVDSKPQRASAGIGTQNQTSARKSKLPTKGGSSFRTPSASKNRGRSGSIEPRVSAGKYKYRVHLLKADFFVKSLIL